MENQFFVCVYFDGEILTTIVGCIIECCKQVTMRFNRNISFDDMKEKISEKIYRRCGRRISKVFYKFPVSTDPIKFTEIELVDDKDVETMVALYCGTRSNQNVPIQLFVELAGVEATENHTPLVEEDGVQVPCMVVPISSDPVDHEVDSESNPNVDEVSDDIDDEGVNEDGNVNASSVGNQIHHIVIHNNLVAYMSRIGPNAARAVEFLEYREILPAHRMVVYSDPEELLVGQRFEKDHRKLNSKIICTCIMPMVKDMPTIKVSVLIAETQARFQYRVSYRKAWIAKQMAMQQLYEDFDASYNKLQGWIAAMREHVPGNVIDFDEGSRYGQMTTNLVEGINAVLLKIRHLPISSVFSATFYRLAILMPRIGQQQVNQMEVGHVFVEDVRDAMVANHQMARSMAVEGYIFVELDVHVAGDYGDQRSPHPYVGV
ncbi:hypothetical protein GOBAR_DD05084 [Gossypium barbadense]|nr:hypothetical protein GOBAR_DD05084 [Gossypium barbadense]